MVVSCQLVGPVVWLAPPSGTTGQLRRHNLPSIPILVHRDRALACADFMRLTGLNRLTAGACLSDLADLGLVYETVPEVGLRAGRPSPIVRVTRIPHRAVNSARPRVSR
jgi:hypothetical protein